MAEKTSPKAGGPKYPIESVDSALRLLKLVAADETVTVSSAARSLDVAPSTAHRLLAMLQHHGLVEHAPAGKTYTLGPWLLELALVRLGETDVRPIARPFIERLVDQVGETTHLVDLQGADSIFLDCVECSMTVRATPRTGQRLPAHCTAGGKAQLAQLGHDRVLALYPNQQLEGMTSKSTRSRDDLLRELDRIAAAGYAVNRAESEDDVHAVAAAIVDGDGVARGAVTVAGPPARMKTERMRAIADDVMATARAIGAALPGPS